MKKFLLFIILAAVTTLFVAKYQSKKNVMHFVEENSGDRNFGAFPPEIPEEEFDNMFI